MSAPASLPAGAVEVWSKEQSDRLMAAVEWIGRQNGLEATAMQLVGELGQGLALLTMGGDLGHPMNRSTVEDLQDLVAVLDATLPAIIRGRVSCPF